MDERPYHEQLTQEEFTALQNPREVDRMPYRLHIWGLVEHGMLYHEGYARPGWDITPDGMHVRTMAKRRFGFPVTAVRSGEQLNFLSQQHNALAMRRD